MCAAICDRAMGRKFVNVKQKTALFNLLLSKDYSTPSY